MLLSLLFILYKIQKSKEAFLILHIPDSMPFFHVSQKTKALRFLMSKDLSGYVS